MRGCFKNIAKIVKKYRRIKGTTQNALSLSLGYKNGQFISNVERGLCSVPMDKLMVLCEKINIPREDLKAAVKADQKEYLDNFLPSVGNFLPSKGVPMAKVG